MRKVLFGICLTLILSIMYIVPAKADTYNDIVYEPIKWEDLIGLEITSYSSLGEAYLELTNEQKEIVHYLIGLYNYMYMGSRGFKYSGVNTDTELQARLRAFGNRLIYGDGFFGWKSRVNERFRQYMSAIIIYASQIRHVDGYEVTFNEWWTNIVQGGHKLYIPYNDDALSAWTDFYNDPSNDGIVSFGEWETEWESGQYFDYEWGNIAFNNSTSENRYNDFIINESPVIFTPVIQNNLYQYCISFQNIDKFDSLYILRNPSKDMFNKYRFGYTDNIPVNNVSIRYIECNNYQDSVIVRGPNNGILSKDIVTTSTVLTLRNIIQYAFGHGPVKNINGQLDGTYFYPFIEHVYLVDDLETLSNKEELIATANLDIDGGRTGWYLETTNGNWYYYDGDPEFDNPSLVENSYKEDDNGDLVPTTSDDFSQSIVNNTVINNYYVVSPAEPINVPSDWFSRGQSYLDTLWYYTEPFAQFVADIFNSLGDIKIVLLACLILGIAAGIIVKFLL